jgi:peptidoglycan/LPS O-acetylase OafA/YrhL
VGNVQALRALAALLVVVVHAYAVESTYLPGRPWTSLFHVFGTYGVDLFFVISGTVIVATTAPCFGTDGAARRFLVRRVTRIYPPYWVVTAVVLAVYLVAPAVTGEHRSARPEIIASFLALPQPGEPLLIVGWTLTYELVFYAIFALALAFRRSALPLVTALWLVVVALIHLAGPTENPWVRVLGSPFNLEFAFGMLIGSAVVRNAFVAPRTLFALAALAVIATFVSTARAGHEYEIVTWLRPLAVGLPMALLVYSVLGLERRYGLVAPRWLRAQGDASYALYLWHVPVIGAIGLVLHRIHLHGTPARVAIVAGGYALAILVSFLAYAYVERPLLRLTRRYAETERTPSATVATSSPAAG